MYTLQAKIIALVIALLGFVGVGYTVYSNIYVRGESAAKAECETRFAKYQKELNDKVAQIEGNLTTIAAINQEQQLLLNSDINEILKRVKKTPITIVKNGNCYPSPTFVEGINQAVDRANKR